MGEKARWIFHACRRRAFVFFCTSYLFFGLILHDDTYRGNDGKIIRRVIFNEKKRGLDSSIPITVFDLFLNE